MTLLHTSELTHPTARSLHAARLELNGLKVAILPTVAEQLAPTSAGAIGTRRNLAETLLDYHRADGSMHTARRLAEESWWWTTWKDETSPYIYVRPGQGEIDFIDLLLKEIDPRSFPSCRPDDIRRNPEARIVCETIALEGWLIMRTDLQTIDRIEVNRWAVEAGYRGKHTAEGLVYDADTTLVDWTYKHDSSQDWIQAGLLACWPDDDDAPAVDVLRNTRRHIGAMILGGTLPMAGRRLLNCLETHPDPIGLVEETRERLPSPTVNAERLHPRHHAEPPARRQPPEPRPEPRPDNDRTTTREHDVD